MIVFCTTCKGRAQHLKETLPRNLADNPGTNCKFVVLDYGSQDDLLEYLKNNHVQEIASGKLTVYSYPTDKPFHMAHAKNMAHRLGMAEGGDVLVNLDADNYTGQGFADYIESTLWGKADTFLYARWRTAPRIPKGCSGRIVVPKHMFLGLGGYDERFDTWGPDDKDFSTRMRRLGYACQEIDVKYLGAVLHTDKMRFREYPHAKDDAYTKPEPTIEDSDTTVVNFGKIGLGTVYKNFDTSSTVELKPLPTRIFGIGLHKTGTTSLSEALKILGYNSAHWESAHWAKRIWQEMTVDGRSKTLERSYAVCDLPIPLLYKQLDLAYPGSKFILTVRDEKKWIESVRKHWSHEHNLYRAQWNDDPFTHKVHKLVYGQKGFDAELFLSKYRQHNWESFRYFLDAGRLYKDFTMMSIDADASWDNLCGFLSVPIPSIPYPHMYATQWCDGGSHI